MFQTAFDILIGIVGVFMKSLVYLLGFVFALPSWGSQSQRIEEILTANLGYEPGFLEDRPKVQCSRRVKGFNSDDYKYVLEVNMAGIEGEGSVILDFPLNQSNFDEGSHILQFVNPKPHANVRFNFEIEPVTLRIKKYYKSVSEVRFPGCIFN